MVQAYIGHTAKDLREKKIDVYRKHKMRLAGESKLAAKIDKMRLESLPRPPTDAEKLVLAQLDAKATMDETLVDTNVKRLQRCLGKVSHSPAPPPPPAPQCAQGVLYVGRSWERVAFVPYKRTVNHEVCCTQAANTRSHSDNALVAQVEAIYVQENPMSGARVQRQATSRPPLEPGGELVTLANIVRAELAVQAAATRRTGREDDSQLARLLYRAEMLEYLTDKGDEKTKKFNLTVAPSFNRPYIHLVKQQFDKIVKMLGLAPPPLSGGDSLDPWLRLLFPADMLDRVHAGRVAGRSWSTDGCV